MWAVSKKIICLEDKTIIENPISPAAAQNEEPLEVVVTK